MRYLLALSLLLLMGATTLLAQRDCASDSHQETLIQDPDYKSAFDERMEKMKRLLHSRQDGNRSMDCATTIPLPVAFHFQGINDPDVECLRQLAAEQLQILNDDYQGMNADIVLWNDGAADFFPGISNGESCIQFCIPTSGHPEGFGLQNGDPAITINQTGNSSFNGDWSGYLNVFVRNIGALGFSPLGGDGNGDGVTVDVAAFGAGVGCSGVVPSSPFNLGRTLTHELGHYLGLGHIWGGGCGNDDGVDDTPNSSGSYGGCPNNGVASCGSTDMHMNYMDYVNDACMYMFSAGQIAIQDAYAEANLQNLIANASLCGDIPDPVPTINFVNTNQSFEEGSSDCVTAGARILNIPLEISGAPDADATVSINTMGTAENFVDYRLLNTSVTFPSGLSAVQFVQVELSEDVVEEENEIIELSFALNLGSSNAVVGQRTSSALTIEDDDVAPNADEVSVATAANINGGFADFNLGPNATVHFYDQLNGKLMLSVINPTGHDFGCTNVSIDRADEDNPGASTTDVGEVDFVTDKTFFISPEVNNFSSSFTVRLYYEDAEIVGFLEEAVRSEEEIMMYKSGIDVPSEMNELEMQIPTVIDFGKGVCYEATYSTGMAGFALGVAAQSLPVELAGLRAVARDKAVDLDWTTLSEVDNAGFSVLRQVEGDADFTALGWVPAANTPTGATYGFTDETALPGNTYNYRLGQQDFDGTTMLSEIVSVSLAVNGLSVRTFPNPADDRLEVQLSSDGPVKVRLTNTNGQVLLAQAAVGTTNVSFDLTTLPSGVYFLLVETDDELTVEKIMRR